LAAALRWPFDDRLDMVGFYVDKAGNTNGMLITRT
jgi:hypothetical protein